jgi:phospholipid/cholesterol/gamma-HCH transport system substrate-binding protein
MTAMRHLTERRRDILTGLVATVLSLSMITLGVMWSHGAFDAGYDLMASFSNAGQGLQSGSDVKIRGVNVGHVDGVRLEDGRALVRLRMQDGREVPVTTQAVVRPKTLFGEKFVDLVPGDAEGAGPFLDDGDEIVDTIGGIELQRIFDDAFPLLEAIDPVELMTVLHTLAEGSRGTGEQVNRTIENFADVIDVSARHDADTRRFLDDFAALSTSLADAADDIVAGARDLNAVLPSLNARGSELSAVLDQAARLSADVADVLENNTSFLERNVVLGGKAFDVLEANLDDVGPTVTGLRQFVQTLSEAMRIPAGDGTLLAAVKFAGITAESLAPAGTSGTGSASPPDGATPLPVPGLADGAAAIVEVLTSVLPPLPGVGS